MFQTVINCLLILCAAGILLLSMVTNARVMDALDLVRREQQPSLLRRLKLHQWLMLFFIFGYLLVALAMGAGLSWISDACVSLIFFFGAIFVYIGVDVKVRFLTEVQSTMSGILPICACCKKIRIDNGAQGEAATWEHIECYISAKAAVSFSHGYCPTCYEQEKKQLARLSAGV